MQVSCNGKNGLRKIGGIENEQEIASIFFILLPYIFDIFWKFCSDTADSDYPKIRYWVPIPLLIGVK